MTQELSKMTKSPGIWHKNPETWQNNPRIWQKSPRILQKCPRIWQKCPGIWLLHSVEVTHSYARHDSFMCGGHDSFTWDIALSYVSHDICKYRALLTVKCRALLTVTAWLFWVWPNSFEYETWFTLNTKVDTLRVPKLIHKWINDSLSSWNPHTHFECQNWFTSESMTHWVRETHTHTSSAKVDSQANQWLIEFVKPTHTLRVPKLIHFTRQSWSLRMRNLTQCIPARECETWQVSRYVLHQYMSLFIYSKTSWTYCGAR